MRERLFQLFLLALRNLVGYPLRSLLTALGVVFGVGSVIATRAESSPLMDGSTSADTFARTAEMTGSSTFASENCAG